MNLKIGPLIINDLHKLRFSGSKREILSFRGILSPREGGMPAQMSSPIFSGLG